MNSSFCTSFLSLDNTKSCNQQEWWKDKCGTEARNGRKVPTVRGTTEFAVGSQSTVVTALEVIDLLGKSVNGFTHGRNTGSRHVESAGNLIFHIRIVWFGFNDKFSTYIRTAVIFPLKSPNQTIRVPEGPRNGKDSRKFRI